MYLKDYSPFLDRSFLYSKSQNIIRVNLLGNHFTSYYIINFLFAYIPSLLVSLPQCFLQGFIIELSYNILVATQLSIKIQTYFSSSHYYFRYLGPYRQYIALLQNPTIEASIREPCTLIYTLCIAYVSYTQVYYLLTPLTLIINRVTSYRLLKYIRFIATARIL